MPTASFSVTILVWMYAFACVYVSYYIYPLTQIQMNVPMNLSYKFIRMYMCVCVYVSDPIAYIALTIHALHPFYSFSCSFLLCHFPPSFCQVMKVGLPLLCICMHILVHMCCL